MKVELMEIAEDFDNRLKEFMAKYNLDKKTVIKMMVGYIDFEYDAEGEIEKKINEVLDEWVKGWNVES